jgi:GH24 family phage-related lysozyme (muramidase)
MNISDNGLKQIKSSQGFRAKPCYLLSNKLVVGYGHVVEPGDGVAGKGDVISSVKAAALLNNDVQKIVNNINDDVASNMTQEEFDELVICSYNSNGK